MADEKTMEKTKDKIELNKNNMASRLKRKEETIMNHLYIGRRTHSHAAN